MTTTKNLLCALLCCGIAACASDQGRDPQTIHNQCHLEMDAARTAVHLREQGKTRQALLDTLPPLHDDSTRLLRQMYVIVDETYRYPELNDVVYGIYHYDICVGQLQLRPVPTLERIYDKLLLCQERYGRQTGHAAVSCVRNSYPGHSQIPAGVSEAGDPE